MHEQLRDLARGRWAGILPALGLPAARLNGKHGPCPICPGGRDRFRFDDKDGRGTWICSVCGAGDGIAFVMALRGVDFKGAVELIEPLIGSASYAQPRKEPADEEKRRWMTELWSGARSVRADDPAGLYLTRRSGIIEYPNSLRFHDRVAYTDGNGAKAYYPALLAKVTDDAGRPANVHRTYLTPAGDKAGLAKPRRMMPGDIPDGAAIRLAPVGEVLGIAEGIETALAAATIHNVPCWAAVNANILSKWLPPAGVKKVIVFGDNDENFTGQHAAYKLANRIAVKNEIETEVRIPDAIATDWDDVLHGRHVDRLWVGSVRNGPWAAGDTSAPITTHAIPGIPASDPRSHGNDHHGGLKA